MKFQSISMLSAGLMLASAALTSPLSATPLPAPLDGVDFSAHGGVTASYNSNVLSSAGNNGGAHTKFDDYIATFNPGLTLAYGGFADTTLKLNFTETFLRYLEHPTLNEDLSNLGFTVARKQGAFDLSAGASYVQNYSNTPSTTPGATAILRSDVLDASANATWNYSDKFNFSTGFDYNNIHYLYTQGATSQDTDTYSVPLSGYYVYTEQLSFGLGYNYSQTDAHNSRTTPPAVGRSRYTNTFSLNTRLTKWNKLTGTANVGVGMNHINAGGGASAQDTTSINYGLNMVYDYSEKVAVTFTGARNFSTGAAGQNIQSTSGGVSVGYKYSDTINAQFNLINYTYSQYLQQNRHDDTKTSGVTLNWAPYNYLTFSAAYSYFMNSSDSAGSTYNINIVSLSAQISY